MGFGACLSPNLNSLSCTTDSPEFLFVHCSLTLQCLIIGFFLRWWYILRGFSPFETWMSRSQPKTLRISKHKLLYFSFKSMPYWLVFFLSYKFFCVSIHPVSICFFCFCFFFNFLSQRSGVRSSSRSDDTCPSLCFLSKWTFFRIFSFFRRFPSTFVMSSHAETGTNVWFCYSERIFFMTFVLYRQRLRSNWWFFALF